MSERHAGTARERSCSPVTHTPAGGSTEGVAPDWDEDPPESWGEYCIAYRRRIVGPCMTCGRPQIGSGPVGFYRQNRRNKGYLCEECLLAEAPRVGTLLRALYDLREAALLLPTDPEESYRSVLQSLLAILELDGWLPRLSEGTEQGPGIRFRGGAASSRKRRKRSARRGGRKPN